MHSIFAKIFAFFYQFVPFWLRPRYILEARARSSQWRKVRAEHLKQQPTCAACGRSKELQVHHIIPVSFDESKELDPNNLITLCASPCHFLFGHCLNYHCYNKDVRIDAARFLASVQARKCLPKEFQR